MLINNQHLGRFISRFRGRFRSCFKQAGSRIMVSARLVTLPSTVAKNNSVQGLAGVRATTVLIPSIKHISSRRLASSGSVCVNRQVNIPYLNARDSLFVLLNDRDELKQQAKRATGLHLRYLHLFGFGVNVNHQQFVRLSLVAIYQQSLQGLVPR